MTLYPSFARAEEAFTDNEPLKKSAHIMEIFLKLITLTTPVPSDSCHVSLPPKQATQCIAELRSKISEYL